MKARPLRRAPVASTLQRSPQPARQERRTAPPYNRAYAPKRPRARRSPRDAPSRHRTGTPARRPLRECFEREHLTEPRRVDDLPERELPTIEPLDLLAGADLALGLSFLVMVGSVTMRVHFFDSDEFGSIGDYLLPPGSRLISSVRSTAGSVDRIQKGSAAPEPERQLRQLLV